VPLDSELAVSLDGILVGAETYAPMMRMDESLFRGATLRAMIDRTNFVLSWKDER